jgi:rod shape-determining protein MreC
MESFVSRYRNAFVLIIVLLAQLLALAVQAKRPAGEGADQPTVSLLRYVVVSVVTPPERLIAGTGHWFGSLWSGYIDLIHVRRENASLEQQVQRLRIEQAGLAQDAAQGQRLQHLLDFKEHYIYKTLPAQIIGTSGTDQSQVLYIDKGSHDGLKQDMPVITADGIVGKLKDVFPHTSQVLLITDPTSGVGVVLQTTRTRGILKGRAFGQLQVVDISPDSRIKAGDPIVTSGGDQIFPRGLPVGTVKRIIPDPERDPLVDVLVQPAAQLAALEEVLVVINVGSAPSPQEAKDIAESEAESEAAQKRASDILSERLPSRYDPNAPADTNPQQTTNTAGNPVRPPAPPAPIHPDHFSPNAEPSAADMTPGHRWAPVKYGTEDTTPPSHPPITQQSGASASAPVAAPATQAGAPSTAAPSQPKASAPAKPKTQVIIDGARVPRKTSPAHPSTAPAETPAKPQDSTQPAPDNQTAPPPQGGIN